MRKFRFLEHTADSRFEAYGKDLGELFANAALALQEIQVETATVSARERRTVTLENDSAEMLLFDFLQELIVIKDAELLLFSAFDVAITRNGSYRLNAACSGETIDPKKHALGVDAKAITLHQFEVKQEKGQWVARVIVDI